MATHVVRHTDGRKRSFSSRAWPYSFWSRSSSDSHAAFIWPGCSKPIHYLRSFSFTARCFQKGQVSGVILASSESRLGRLRAPTAY